MNSKSIWGDRIVEFVEHDHNHVVEAYEVAQVEIDQLLTKLGLLKEKRQTKNVVADIKAIQDRLNYLLDNTATPIKGEEFVQAMLSNVDQIIERFEKIMEELKDKFMVNPIYSLEWDFEIIVTNQQTLIRYNQTRGLFANTELIEWESKHEALVRRIQDEVMSEAINPSSSTNSGSNLVARYELAANAKFVSPDNWNGVALSNVVIFTLIEMSNTRNVVFLV